MALIKPTAPEERTATLNSSKQLPRNNYAIRFIEQKFGPASSHPNNPMITLVAEIVAPATVVSPFTGETLEVAGAKLKPFYFVLQVKDKETGQPLAKDTQEAINRYTDFRKKCGLEVPDEGIDNENPVLDFKGVVVDAILDSEEFVQRATPTPEQKAAGKLGDEIKVDGKSIKSYKPFSSMVLGPSSVDVSNNPMLS